MPNPENCTNEDEFAVVFNMSDGSLVKVIGPNDDPNVTGVPVNKGEISDADLIVADPAPIKFVYKNPVCCIVHMGRLYCWC